MIVTCYSCGNANEFPSTLGRRDHCAKCNAELRCCLQCKLHNADSLPECKEPQAELPRERDRGNFCEFFVAGPGRSREQSDAEKAKAAFSALFGRK
jgi:hypothetical protein